MRDNVRKQNPHLNSENHGLNTDCLGGNSGTTAGRLREDRKQTALIAEDCGGLRRTAGRLWGDLFISATISLQFS